MNRICYYQIGLYLGFQDDLLRFNSARVFISLLKLVVWCANNLADIYINNNSACHNSYSLRYFQNTTCTFIVLMYCLSISLVSNFSFRFLTLTTAKLKSFFELNKLLCCFFQKNDFTRLAKYERLIFLLQKYNITIENSNYMCIFAPEKLLCEWKRLNLHENSFSKRSRRWA